MGAIQPHVGGDGLALDVLGLLHHGGFDFPGAHVVAGDIQYVVDAAHDGGVTHGTVARQVVLAAQVFREVALLEAVGVVQMVRIMDGKGRLMIVTGSQSALPEITGLS